jgi:hypothetical protein
VIGIAMGVTGAGVGEGSGVLGTSVIVWQPRIASNKRPENEALPLIV